MPQWKRKSNKKKKTKKSWKSSVRLQPGIQVNVEEVLNIEIVKPTDANHDSHPKVAEDSGEVSKIDRIFETKTEDETETVSRDGILDHADDTLENIIDAGNDDYDYDDYYEELAENSEYELSVESSVDDYDDFESDDDCSDDTLTATNAVIRGIPIHFTEEQVIAKLWKFTPIAVHRMISKETWQPMPLVLVQVPECQRDWLFDMKRFDKLPVKVEELRLSYDISQCKKCKQFGHVQNECELLSSWKQEASLGNGSSTGDLGIGTTVSNNSLSSSVGSSHSSSNFSTSSSSMHDENNELAISSTSNILLRVDKMLKTIDRILKGSLNLSWNGIPTEIATIHIRNDLKSKGFSVTEVYRLKDDDDRPTERVVFQVPKEQDHIFYMCCCLGFHVVTEKYDGDFSRVASDDHKEFSMKKPIHVVLRGVPKDVPENDVLEDLKRKHFSPVSVTRLVNPTANKKNNPLNVVLLQMHREESHIYKLKCVLGFPIEVEGFLRHVYPVPQCKQCKKFGHLKDCPEETRRSEKTNYPQESIEPLNVVLKGIPLEYENDNIIFDELKKCSFNPIAIHRMALGREILPMYLVQVPKTERRILFLTCFLGFDITVQKHNPHLYPINQCDYCKNFGHHEGRCPDRLEKTDKSYIDEDIQLEKEEIPISQNSEDHVQSSTKRKRENSEAKQYVFDVPEKEREYEDHSPQRSVLRNSSDNSSVKSVDGSSISKSDISLTTESFKVTIDAFTNTDSIDDSMDGLNRNVEAYQSISQSFLENMSSFVTSYEQYDMGSSSLDKTLQCILNLQSLCILTSPFLDGVITVLKSMTSIMIDMPYIPGVKANTLDEQLHLLEKLEEIKKNLEACPGKFTRDYDTHFPELR